MTNDPVAQPMFNAGHALVIGVGSYANAPTMNVPLTAEDARQVAAVLRDPRYCAYPPNQVTLLTDADATRQNILAALDRLATTAGDDATVLLFYSGHGAFGDEGYYLTTYDTQMVNENVQTDTGVRESELLARLNAIKAQRALLIFNACHSGAIAPDSLGDAPSAPATPTGATLPDQLTSALLATGAGRVVVTACKEKQLSYFVRNAKTTLFAQALLDTLQGRGVDSRHGFISVFDLYEYVYANVTGEVKRRWGLAQDPVLTIHQGVGVMAVALYQGSAPQGSLGAHDRPTTLAGATREVDPHDSKAALQQILTGTVNLAAGRDISDNVIVGGDINNGDRIDARQAQGFINRPSGPISQNFGTQHNVSTGGGDYASGNIDKRQGAFVSGGTVNGPVTGTNTGEITTDYRVGTEQQGQAAAAISLRDVRRALRQAIDTIANDGPNDLASDLDEVDRNLGAAIQAEAAHNSDQRARKLRQVQDDLASIGANRQELREVVRLVQQVS